LVNDPSRGIAIIQALQSYLANSELFVSIPHAG